ncbi:MAG: YeiH family putative sulfate export transporter [Burkholderiaceae bacterium]|nr:YeiH family putative sulfate export transporter [Burkholderiaceae bacterium]
MLSGLLLSGALALAAIKLGGLPWLQAHGLSALTMAIILGIVLGNTLYPLLPRLAANCGEGVGFSKQTLLRAGVVLYGLRLTFQDIGRLGAAGVVIDAAMLSSTFLLALLLGICWLKLERDTAILIGAGSAICGAAAVMATEPVVRARSEQVTVAVSTVVVFGTLAIFLYPLLYRPNLAWRLIAPSAFGVYAGSTIHEVAQVVAAARMVSEDTAGMAVIAKMVRVMMLTPFLLALSAWLARRTSQRVNTAGQAQPPVHITVPWFAFAFIGMVCLNSILPSDLALRGSLLDLDTLLLAMAMAALGLTTHVAAIRRAGLKPLLLAAMLFVWLVVGGAAVNRWVVLLLN